MIRQINQELTQDIVYLEHSLQQQNKTLIQMLNEVSLLHTKLVTQFFNQKKQIRRKIYEPQKILMIIKHTHLQNIIEFLTLKQQLSLRLISKQFNREIRLSHLQSKYNLSRLLFYKEDLQSLQDSVNQFDPSFLQDSSLIQQVQLQIQVLLSPIDSDIMNVFQNQGEYNPGVINMTNIFLQFLFNPELDPYKYNNSFLLDNIPLNKKYAHSLYNGKTQFLKYFWSINVYTHPNIEKLQIIVKNFEQEALQMGSTNLIYECFEQLLLLKSIKNVEYFAKNVNLTTKIQCLTDMREKIKIIYKIKDEILE